MYIVSIKRHSSSVEPLYGDFHDTHNRAVLQMKYQSKKEMLECNIISTHSLYAMWRLFFLPVSTIVKETEEV